MVGDDADLILMALMSRAANLHVLNGSLAIGGKKPTGRITPKMKVGVRRAVSALCVGVRAPMVVFRFVENKEGQRMHVLLSAATALMHAGGVFSTLSGPLPRRRAPLRRS